MVISSVRGGVLQRAIEREVESDGAALGCGYPQWLRQFHWLWCFWQQRWWASLYRVLSFDLSGYSALTAEFFGWSRACSSKVSLTVAGILMVCVSLTGAGFSTIAVFPTDVISVVSCLLCLILALGSS
jgi:hypothetical protein